MSFASPSVTAPGASPVAASATSSVCVPLCSAHSLSTKLCAPPSRSRSVVVVTVPSPFLQVTLHDECPAGARGRGVTGNELPAVSNP